MAFWLLAYLLVSACAALDGGNSSSSLPSNATLGPANALTPEPTPQPTVTYTNQPALSISDSADSAESDSPAPTLEPTPPPHNYGNDAPLPSPSPTAPSADPTLEPTIATGNPTLEPTPYPSPSPVTPSPTTMEPTLSPSPQPTPLPTPGPTTSPTPRPTPQPTTPAPTFDGEMQCGESESGNYGGEPIAVKVKMAYDGEMTITLTDSNNVIDGIVYGGVQQSIPATLTDLTTNEHVQFNITGAADAKGAFTIAITCTSPAPTKSPTGNPTAYPTTNPTVDPTTNPTTDPSANPSANPSTNPTRQPTADPSADPTANPSADPTVDPTAQPSADPTRLPTTDPSAQPTREPTRQPTGNPTVDPTTVPSTDPTTQPTVNPSASPTKVPTTMPPTHFGTLSCNNGTKTGPYHGQAVRVKVQMKVNGHLTIDASASDFEVSSITFVGKFTSEGVEGYDLNPEFEEKTYYGDVLDTATVSDDDLEKGMVYYFDIMGADDVTDGNFEVDFSCGSSAPTKEPSARPTTQPTPAPTKRPVFFPINTPSPTDSPTFAEVVIEAKLTLEGEDIFSTFTKACNSTGRTTFDVAYEWVCALVSTNTTDCDDFNITIISVTEGSIDIEYELKSRAPNAKEVIETAITAVNSSLGQTEEFVIIGEGEEGEVIEFEVSVVVGEFDYVLYTAAPTPSPTLFEAPPAPESETSEGSDSGVIVGVVLSVVVAAVVVALLVWRKRKMEGQGAAAEAEEIDDEEQARDSEVAPLNGDESEVEQAAAVDQLPEAVIEDLKVVLDARNKKGAEVEDESKDEEHAE